MIVVDTSALIEILLDASQAEACLFALTNASNSLISAGTVLELIIVSRTRGILGQLDGFLKP